MIPLCPKCGGALTHDKFEDCYNCFPCNTFFYPVELGLPDDTDAGYRHLRSQMKDDE